jgi:hypothetical protein
MKAGFIAIGNAGFHASIVGAVTDSATGATIAGATVQLGGTFPVDFAARLQAGAARYGASWDALAERPDRTQTRYDGSFGFLDLPAGTYALTVTVPAGGYSSPAATGSATVAANAKAAVVMLTAAPS